MFVHRTKTTTVTITSDGGAIQEATRVLEQHRLSKATMQRWVCEVCGMIHIGSAPETCDSCGKYASLVPQTDFRTEISSRW